jgi:hypothetical protein
MEGEASVCWAIIAPHEHIMDWCSNLFPRQRRF